MFQHNVHFLQTVTLLIAIQRLHVDNSWDRNLDKTWFPYNRPMQLLQL